MNICCCNARAEEKPSNIDAMENAEDYCQSSAATPVRKDQQKGVFTLTLIGLTFILL